MKSGPECIPCILKQVLKTARRISQDEWVHRKLLNKCMTDLLGSDFARPPAEISFECLMDVYRALGVKDPHAAEKKESNNRLLKIYDELEKKVRATKDPFKAALKLSLAGNLLDLRMSRTVGVEEVFKTAETKDPAIDHSEQLRDALRSAERVLYILDNAGEIVLDKLFISTFPKTAKTTCVVRRSPIINDVTMEDFETVSLSKLAEPIDPGVDALGIPLRHCSRDFQETFETADIVICKGQANFETLNDAERELFFLFVAKCECISRQAGVQYMDMVICKKKKSKKVEPEKAQHTEQKKGAHNVNPQ